VFQELEKRFTKELVLAVPDLDNKKMRMEVNILHYTMKGVLSMECEDVSSYKGLENWRHLLESAKFKFEVWTYHKNLEYFIKVQKLNQKQA